MPDYRYRALNPRGRVQRGELTAASPYDLQHQLQQAGISLIESRERPVSSRRFNLRSQGPHLRNLAQLCLHIAQLERAAVRLTDTLRDVAATLPADKLRTALNASITEIEAGGTLSEALALRPTLFPTPMPALVAAGEATGRLGDVFGQLASHFDWRAKLRARIMRVIAYPLFSLVTMVSVVFFLLGYVVPQTSAFLHDMNVALPAHTVALLKTAEFVSTYGMPLLIVLLCTTFSSLFAYRRSTAFASWADRQLLHAPVIGSLWRRLELARFTRSLAMMVDSEIDLLTALATSAQAIRNRALLESITTLREQVQNGIALSRAAQLSGEFPSLVQRMLSVGEQGGKMPSALYNVADYYEADVQRNAEDLVATLGPTITIVTGGLLIWLVTAVFMPIYDALPQMM